MYEAVGGDLVLELQAAVAHFEFVLCEVHIAYQRIPTAPDGECPVNHPAAAVSHEGGEVFIYGTEAKNRSAVKPALPDYSLQQYLLTAAYRPLKKKHDNNEKAGNKQAFFIHTRLPFSGTARRPYLAPPARRAGFRGLFRSYRT